MVPTFTGVIVACSISGISISSFFVWMIPMALLTLLAIYLVYLRRVPRTVGETGRSKKECVRLLLRSLWSLLLALLMSVSFASSQLSPTHICTAIISDYFDVTFFATVKKLLPLFLLTILIACGYYVLLTAVF